MATCPECDADLDIDEAGVDEGDIVTCGECGETFTVTGVDPLELELTDDDDEDDEDDEDEGDDFDDEDELDEDEEEEEEEKDWEE
jgi:alpha-aminoadipate carrier protein LysW